MIKCDNQGNLHVLLGDSGNFLLKGLPRLKGTLKLTFNGDEKIEASFDIDNDENVLVQLSRQDIEALGVGSHLWYAELERGDELDTIAYQNITVYEKE